MKKPVKIFFFFYCFLNYLCVSFSQTVDHSLTSSERVMIPSSMGSSSYQPTSQQTYSEIEKTLNDLELKKDQQLLYDSYEVCRRMALGVDSLRDKKTGVAPSHLGHPGYESAAFTYDKAVDALVLKAAGADRQAREVMEYFSKRVRISFKEVKQFADANGIYGILKLYPSSKNAKAVGLVNAINVRSTSIEGVGQLEYFTTPGPLAFMLMAFLYVDRVGYLQDALKMGEALLAMQREDGAVVDGDRDALNVHTEPHMDTFSAFLMLYQVTKDMRWKIAAEKAWDWFEKNVFHPDRSVIYQGIHHGRPSEVFATDAYSWTLAGPAGDRMSLDVLEKLTDRMLKHSVSRVTLEVPDGTMRTVTLVDFADVKDMRVNADRGGFHPMGSVEWIGGVILALQKNAVRFWQEGSQESRQKASFYKALAEYFILQALNSFYEVKGVDGFLSFYATGQWIATGHGWRTPYFYVKNSNGQVVLRGGSTIGSWPVLPLKRQNPFILDDQYGYIYDGIPYDAMMKQKAEIYVDDMVMMRTFVENVPLEIMKGADEIPELWRYNMQMFKAFVTGDYYATILWAQKVLNNTDWMRLARQQQQQKEEEIGGIIDYPWGKQEFNAPQPARMIRRYPLLNEVGAAMWGMAVAHFKLKDHTQAKHWIRAMIESVPYHQIYAPDGPGYWNALVSWETNPAGSQLDAQMGILYREVLRDLKKRSALPPLKRIK